MKPLLLSLHLVSACNAKSPKTVVLFIKAVSLNKDYKDCQQKINSHTLIYTHVNDVFHDFLHLFLTGFHIQTPDV